MGPVRASRFDECSFMDRFEGHNRLQEAIQSFGGLNERPRRAICPTEAPGVTLPHGAAERPRKLRDKRRPTSALRTVADLMRGWQSYEAAEATLSDQHRGAGAEAAVLHSKLVAGLTALQRLAGELELSFWAVQETLREGPVEWAADLGVVTERPAVHQGEEVSMSLELQGSVRTSFGKAHSLVLRVPWAFEIVASDSQGLEEPSWSDGKRRPHRSKMTGDHCHAVCVALQERVPETLRLQRKAPQGGCRATESDVARPSLRPVDWLKKVEDWSAKAEERLRGRLEQHVQVRQEAGEDLEFLERDLPDGCRLEDYLGDVREAVRTLRHGLPSTSQLLEEAVKGVVLALDGEVELTRQELLRRRASEEALAEAQQEIEYLRNDLAATQQQNSELKSQVTMANDLKQAEVRVYQEKIERLKEELGRLYPEDGSVEGVCYLMDTCAKLLLDLEEESTRQTTILQDMGAYTSSIVKEVAENEHDIALHRPGRVVELPDGELLLRPYSVVDEGTQLMETDLLKADVEAPIRFRSPMVRQLLACFQGRDVKKMTVKELEAEIDRLYTAKTSADNEADAAGLPRSELAAFLVEFYLEQSGSVTAAQERVASILNCIRQLERTALLAPLPLKVSLFARFLQFCTVAEVLPLPLLNIGLQARRFAGAGRQKVQEARPPQLALGRRPTVTREREEEVQISLPAAWDAATRALPSSNVISRRELFVCMMRFASFASDEAKSGDMKDFFVLLLIIHDRLRREAAPKMRYLISKVENRGTATCDEFRDALRDAQLLGIEDSIWRWKLCPPAALGQQATLSDQLVMEYLGGGSLSKIPRAHVTESQLLWSTVEATQAEVRDRIEGFRKIHRVNRENSDEKRLKYADFKAILQSSDFNMSSSNIRSHFISSVEVSRSCFQYEGDACPVAGTLEAAASGLYGGDVVTLQHVGIAMTKNLIQEQALDWSTAGKMALGERDNSPSNQSVASGFQAKPASPMAPSPSASGRSIKSPRNTNK